MIHSYKLFILGLCLISSTILAQQKFGIGAFSWRSVEESYTICFVPNPLASEEVKIFFNQQCSTDDLNRRNYGDIFQPEYFNSDYKIRKQDKVHSYQRITYPHLRFPKKKLQYCSEVSMLMLMCNVKNLKNLKNDAFFKRTKLDNICLFNNIVFFASWCCDGYNFKIEDGALGMGTFFFKLPECIAELPHLKYFQWESLRPQDHNTVKKLLENSSLIEFSIAWSTPALDESFWEVICARQTSLQFLTAPIKCYKIPDNIDNIQELRRLDIEVYNDSFARPTQLSWALARLPLLTQMVLNWMDIREKENIDIISEMKSLRELKFGTSLKEWEGINFEHIAQKWQHLKVLLIECRNRINRLETEDEKKERNEIQEKLQKLLPNTKVEVLFQGYFVF